MTVFHALSRLNQPVLQILLFEWRSNGIRFDFSFTNGLTSIIFSKQFSIQEITTDRSIAFYSFCFSDFSAAGQSMVRVGCFHSVDGNLWRSSDRSIRQQSKYAFSTILSTTLHLRIRSLFERFVRHQ